MAWCCLATSPINDCIGKIAATIRTLGLSRFDLKYSNGALPHDSCLRSIALYGGEVVPRVRALLAS